VSGQLITKGYADILREGLEKVQGKEGGTKGDLAKTLDMGRTTLWRLLSGQPNVTVEKAERIREYLATEGQESIPPPVVPIESADHFAFVELGAQLAREDPAYLRRVIAAMRKRVEGQRADRELFDDDQE
jgi:transcriptional regulator with XRE-family HTH domain